VLDGAESMRGDTIFRIASMTKPNTAAATMMDGGLVGNPVDQLLPELADRRGAWHLVPPADD